MRTHIIVDGQIVTTIVATVQDAQEAFPEAICREASFGGAIGDGFDEATNKIIPAPRAALTPEQQNAPILDALEAIDRKTPRAVREAMQTGDESRVIELEAQAAALRSQLVKV